MIGVVPAHQRLRADDAPVGQRHQWLVVDLHLAAVDHVVQRRAEVEPADRAHADPVDAEHGELAPSAERLRPVHGDVRVVEQVVARLAVFAERDADAHRGDHLVPGAQRDRVVQRLEDGGGDLAGVVGRGDALEQDDELVAAEARQGVTGPDGTSQPVRDDPQQLVAHLVAQVVVDDLEAVDVTEEHGDPAAGPVRLEQCVVQMVEEEPPVRQAGQRVLERVPGQLLLEGLALGRVAEDDDGPRGRRGPDEGRRRHGDGEIRSVEPPKARVRAGDVASQRDRPQGRLEQEVRRLARREGGPVGAGLEGVPAQHAGTGRVHEGDLALLADGAHALPEAVEDDRQFLPSLLVPLVLLSLRGLAGRLGVGRGTGAGRTRRLIRRLRGRTGGNGRPGGPAAPDRRGDALHNRHPSPPPGVPPIGR